MSTAETTEPRHLLQTIGLSGMQDFYVLRRLIPTSTNADIALILSHIAYWSGCQAADRVTISPSRGHSYRVDGSCRGKVIVRIRDYYDHRDGVTGWC